MCGYEPLGGDGFTCSSATTRRKLWARNPIGRYFVASEPLAAVISRSSQLRVELNTFNSDCNVYQNRTRCWQGKLVSNVLQLPK